MKILKFLILSVVLSLSLLILGGLVVFNSKINQLDTGLSINEISEIETYKTAKSRIYIVGTDHIEGENFNSDSILYALCKIRPDIVAIESDSLFFDKDFNYKFTLPFKLAIAFGKANFENEIKAIINYRIINNSTQYRPYDISNRNQFQKENAIHSNTSKALSVLNNLYEENKLSPQNAKTYRNWLSTNKEYNNLWSENNYPSIINSKHGIDICRRRQLLKYDSLNQVIQSETMMEGYKDFYLLNKDWWHLRNKTMVANILSISSEFKNEKIVILTGGSHKYYLIDEINNLPEKHFEIDEFYN